MSTDFSFTDDVLDVRDLIERFEELEEAKDEFVQQIEDWRTEIEELEERFPDLDEIVDYDDIVETGVEISTIERKIKEFGEWHETDEGEEFIQLEKILEELCGNGGDEKWRGSWYPSTLINSDYFTGYIKEELEDCGYIPRDLPSWIEIDWESTAENCKMDYTEIEIENETYYYR